MMQDHIQSSPSMNSPHGVTRAITTRRGMDAGLYNAAVEGSVQVLQLYRESLSSQLTPAGNTVLHLHVGVPAKKHKVAKIQFIQTVLNYQESLLLQRNENDEIPLHLAARFGHIDAVDVFIKQVVARDVRSLREMLMMSNRNKDTALHLAVRWNNVQIVKLLVMADRDCLYARNNDGETPLYDAAERKHPEVLAIILDCCVSPTFEGPCGRTALHAAALWRHEGMLNNILGKNNLLLKSQDDEGQTPLHYAAATTRRTEGTSQALIVLLQDDDPSQSAVYIQDNEGRTALHLAALYGDVDRIKSLIEHRPDCSEIRDNKGQNLFHYAINSGCRQTIKYLKGNGIFSKFINEKDQDGNTPLHLLATSLSCAPLSYFLCMKDLTENEEIDLMASNSQNQTAGDILHSLLSCNIEARKDEIAISIHQVVPRDVRTPFRKKLDETLVSRYEEKNKHRMFKHKKSCEVHLIVTTLIATVSFTVGIAVPGGFNQDVGVDQGTALLTRQTAFRAFMVSNAIALTFSAVAILLYFHIAMVSVPSKVRSLYPVSLVCSLLSVGALVVAFMTGTYAIVYQSPSLVAMILAFPVIFMVGYACDLLSIIVEIYRHVVRQVRRKHYSYVKFEDEF